MGVVENGGRSTFWFRLPRWLSNFLVTGGLTRIPRGLAKTLNTPRYRAPLFGPPTTTPSVGRHTEQVLESFSASSKAPPIT